MKFIVKMTIATAVLMTSRAYSQGFINLNFEHPVLPLAPVFNEVPTVSAIPGWTASYITSTSTNQTDAVWYNTVSLGGAFIALEDTNNVWPLPIQGTYSVFLEGSTASTPTAASIAQTGQIPTNAQSLTFFGNLTGNSSMELTIDNQLISYTALGSGANYTLYGADISQFAGQTITLGFTTLTHSFALLDNIQFSATPVPEPGTLALVALGGLLLGGRRGKKP